MKPYCNFPRATRRAFTLIEMLVSISIGSVIMLTAVSLVHQALALRQTMQSRVEEERGYRRFVELLRCDAHRAVDVAVESTGLSFHFSDSSRVDYVAQSNKITRTQNSEPPHVERFVGEETSQFELLLDRSERLVSLNAKYGRLESEVRSMLFACMSLATEVQP